MPPVFKLLGHQNPTLGTSPARVLGIHFHKLATGPSFREKKGSLRAWVDLSKYRKPGRDVLL